jgi:hypothetical protein
MAILRLAARVDGNAHADAISQIARLPEGESLSVQWDSVRWIELPEAISVLIWSARTGRTRSVAWTFSIADDKIDDLRFSAILGVGEKLVVELEKELNRTASSLRSRKLFSRQVIDKLAELEAHIVGRPASLLSWFDSARKTIDRAFVLGFLHRYDVLHRAVEAGIEIATETWQMPAVTFARAANTASLPLVYFAAASGVTRQVERLSDPDELARVFGTRATMDVISGGALAQIIVKELGANVVEHSNCDNAWLSTRLVSWSESSSDAFLEVIVADDGDGLAASVAPLIAGDQRTSVQRLYNEATGLDRTGILIAYAFDRFTSAKRGLRELLHLASNDSALVSSGLFWIWSLVSSELGVIVVRSNGVEVTFDLSVGTNPTLDTVEQIRATMAIRPLVAEGTTIPFVASYSWLSPSSTSAARQR